MSATGTVRKAPADVPFGQAADLPGEWQLRPLSSVATFSRKPREAHAAQSNIPFLEMAKIPDGSFSAVREWAVRPSKEIRSGVFFQEGDILLAKITPCLENGKQMIARGVPGGWGMATTEVFAVHPTSVDTDFLAFYLKLPSVRRWLASKMEGTTGRQRLPKRVLEVLRVPCPPAAEQQRIARVLSTAQRAIEAQDKVVAAARELKRSLMRHLFTYGPVPVHEAAGLELMETECGTIPAHWRGVLLGDKAAIGNGSTPKRTEPRYWQGGKIPWLTSGKVHEGTISQAGEFVTEDALRECHLPRVPKGSLVVAITGQGKTLGNVALLAIQACISQHLAHVTIHDNQLVAEFVLGFLRSRYEQLQSASRGGGSTKGALTCGFLKRFPVPFPPLDEQQQIAAILSSVDKKIIAEQGRQEALMMLFKSMLHHLMTGKLRVPETLEV
jgi:type I restriction enzyme S subunit